MISETCGGGHMVTDYPIEEVVPGHRKQVDFIGSALRPQGNPCSNTYNHGKRNHHNFSWNNQG